MSPEGRILICNAVICACMFLNFGLNFSPVWFGLITFTGCAIAAAAIWLAFYLER